MVVQTIEDAGQTRTFEICASPLLDEDGEICQVVKSYRDITVRRQEDLESLRREKLEGVVEMAGAACHELGQPLQALALLAHMMKKEGSSNERKVAEEVDRLGQIIDKIMRITRYATREYVGGATIIDIDEASKPLTNE